MEVCVGGVWGSVCRDTYWDNADASVICGQLGFSKYGMYTLYIQGFGGPIGPGLGWWQTGNFDPRAELVSKLAIAAEKMK